MARTFQEMNTEIAASRKYLSVRQNTVLPSPKNLSGHLKAGKGSAQIEGLHPIGKQRFCHVSLTGTQRRILAQLHRGLDIVVADSVRRRRKTAQPGRKALGAAGAGDPFQRGGVNLRAKARRCNQADAGDLPGADVGNGHDQSAAQRMSDQMNVAGIRNGRVKRLHYHPGEVGEAIDSPLWRFSVAGQIDADQVAASAKRFLKGGPALAVSGEGVNEDNRTPLTLTVGDVQRSGFGSPAGACEFCGDGIGPALETGDDALTNAPFNLGTDQRGFARKSGLHVDMGAFEHDSAAWPAVSVTTLGASAGASSSVSGTGPVTFNGSINPGGLIGTANFQYGLATNYGGIIPVTWTNFGTNAVAVNATTNGLGAGIIYHYRLVVTNADGAFPLA